MSILVSDTSVLIDLERANLVREVFGLPYQFAVPDLLYKNELAGALGDQLVAYGLVIETLTPGEVRAAQLVRQQDARLSLPDAFAFAIAKSRAWALLTGDGALRERSMAEGVSMHGVLWLFDELANGNHVPFGQLHQSLSTLAGHSRCRLPRTAVRERLQRFDQAAP